MVRQASEELADYCREEIGEKLRAVTYYSADTHDPVFTRKGVIERMQITEESRQMFRHPLLQMNKAVWQLSNVHPMLDGPDVAIYSYGDVSVVQFPLGESDGVVVSFDWEGELPGEFISNCKSIVYEHD